MTHVSQKLAFRTVRGFRSELRLDRLLLPLLGALEFVDVDHRAADAEQGNGLYEHVSGMNRSPAV